MGFMCGGEFIEDSRDLYPADDAGICYDVECAGEPEDDSEDIYAERRPARQKINRR